MYNLRVSTFEKLIIQGKSVITAGIDTVNNGITSKNVGDAFGEKRYLRLECYLGLRPDQR